MKKYVCDGLEECKILEPDINCLHKKEHFLVEDGFIGCKGGYCAILERETSCIDVRKLKLEKVVSSREVE